MQRFSIICLLLVSQLPVWTSAAPAEELRASFLMLADPAIEAPPLTTQLPEGIAERWQAALKRPEPFYRLSAAVDILHASQAGFGEDVKTTIPELRQLLRERNTTPEVRVAVAVALIALDARDSAEELFEACREGGSQFRQLSEPALAQWNFQPIRKVWRDRLQQETTRRRELVLACEGSGRVRDREALPALLTLIHAPERPRDVRLSAARAAGEIAESGLEEEAGKLLADDNPPLINRLCAVALLQHHDSSQAQELLTQMFDDPAGPVAASAIERLYDIDPALVLELVPQAWQHPDTKVRQVAANCLISFPTPEHVETLAHHLNDPHPALRRRISQVLLEFAPRPELEPTIRQSVTEVLNSADWRGQEEACLILGQLDHEAAAPRLAELLKSDRSEVMIASAWALRKVAVKDVLPAMLEQAQDQNDHPKVEDLAASDRQVAHLFEGMAMMDYRPAIRLMRRHVPLDISHRRLCRAAAIWGLGYLLKDAQDEQFAKQLMGRIQSLTSDNPDIEIVGRMSAISLGRMKAASQLEALKSFAGPEPGDSPVEESIRWAVREISGEVLPHRDPTPYVLTDWRVQPVLPE